MSDPAPVAAVAVVAEDARLGRLLHRPKRAARARLLADACDAVAVAPPLLCADFAVWSADGTTVSMTRAPAGGNDGRLLIDLNVEDPEGHPMRGALIHVMDRVQADIGAKVRPDTLAVTAALLRAAAGAIDGSGPFLHLGEWDVASRAICRDALARSPDGPNAPREADPSFLGAVAAARWMVPDGAVLHDHKPLGPLSPQTLHWHSPGSIHPVEPPECPAVAEVSIDRQGRIRLSFLWRPEMSSLPEDAVATLRAVAALRGAAAASLATRPEDRA